MVSCKVALMVEVAVYFYVTVSAVDFADAVDGDIDADDDCDIVGENILDVTVVNMTVEYFAVESSHQDMHIAVAHIFDHCLMHNFAIPEIENILQNSKCFKNKTA